MGQLDGKVAVITGGNSGIGLATAKRFGIEGARVVIFGRDAKTLSDAAAELGEPAMALSGDIAKLEDINRLIAETVERFGHIDILFANAGIAPFRPFNEISEEFFDEIVNINIKGVFFTIQKAVPHMREGGSIVVTTSVTNEMGLEGGNVYAASKAAARSLVRGLAAELITRRIRVNAVRPGPIDTPIHGRQGFPPEEVEQMIEEIKSRVPMKRFGTSEEVANVALFLASEESSYVVGSEFTVDGGTVEI